MIKIPELKFDNQAKLGGLQLNLWEKTYGLIKTKAWIIMVSVRSNASFYLYGPTRQWGIKNFSNYFQVQECKKPTVYSRKQKSIFTMLTKKDNQIFYNFVDL